MKLQRVCSILTILAASIAILPGCSDDSSTSNGGMGEIRMYLLDAPTSYDAVNIVVTEVEVHQANANSNNGWWVVNDSTATYDLLQLTNGLSAVLGDEPLPVGHYTQIRLHLGEGSNLVVDGIPHNLEIPSGMQSGLKLNHPFDIEDGVLYELTLDFDAEQSINQTGNGQYMMNPVIRVVANAVSGTISGTIDPPAAHAQIWTMAGADTISAWADTTSGQFMLMALPEGLYDVTVIPTAGAYNDTTFTGVAVEAQQNTELGIIHLTSG